MCWEKQQQLLTEKLLKIVLLNLEVNGEIWPRTWMLVRHGWLYGIKMTALVHSCILFSEFQIKNHERWTVISLISISSSISTYVREGGTSKKHRKYMSAKPAICNSGASVPGPPSRKGLDYSQVLATIHQNYPEDHTRGTCSCMFQFVLRLTKAIHF